MWFNIIMFLIFALLLILTVVYKHKTKPTAKQLASKKVQDEEYILNKIRTLTSKNNNNIQITKLPLFESPFEMLHRKFYMT